MRRALLIALLTLAFPATASAADTVIGFDDLAPGTQVKEQYKAKGLVLSRNQSGDVGQTLVARKLPSAPGNALEIQPGGCGGEFPCDTDDYRLDGRVDFARQFVRVTVLDTYALGPTTLRAYRSDGSQVGIQSQGSGSSTPFTLEVSSAKQDIQFIAITGAKSIDDVTFDNPANPPPPDFSIYGQFPAFQGPDAIRVRAGSQVTVSVLVNRFNFSSGPIGISPLLDTTTGINAGGGKSTSGPDGTVLPFTFKVPKNAKAQTLPITIRATAGSIAAGPAGKQSDVSFKLVVFRDYDLRVTGIEVTQGIQRELVRCVAPSDCDENQSLPFRDPANPTAPVPYNGFSPFPYRQATLVAGKRTVARVFANVKDPSFPSGITVPNTAMELVGFAGGKKLPESPLQPELGGRALSSGGPDDTAGGGGQPWVTFKDRADPREGATFTLPDSWTRKSSLTLRAQLTPYKDAFDELDSRECTEQACKDNNVFTLSDIPFHNVGSVRLATAWLFVDGESRFGPANGAFPGSVLPLADLLIPLAEGDLRYDPGFYASINVQEALDDNPDDDRDAMYDAKDILEDYADEYPGCEWADFCADTILGMYSGGWTTRGTSDSDFPEGVAVAPISRLPTLAHEISHNLGREHAGENCPGIGENGQTAEDWPPDERGVMDGIGLDTRPGSGGPNQAYAVVAPGNLGAPAMFPGGPAQQVEYFDQQSYCRKGDADRWTSVTGLERYFEPTMFIPGLGPVDLVPPTLDLDKIQQFVGAHAGASAASSSPLERRIHAALVRGGLIRSAAAGTRLLHVQAIDEPGGARVTVVKERVLKPRKLPDTSDYHLVVRDAAGAQLADVPMEASTNPPDPQVQLTGQAPVTGGATIEVTRGGTVIARRERSAAKPSVRILSPRKGARVGARRGTVVRGRATDGDGGELRAKIDYSFDDGRNFTPIWSGANSGRAVIPSALLSGSRKARLRVRVSDGWNEGQATSARFRAAGRKPRLRLLAPAPRQRVMRDAFLPLSVEAYDDRRRRLGKGALRWFAGKREIARGRRASVTGLPAGRRRIRVVARDLTGKTAVASMIVRVVPVKPRFIQLGTPRHVKARARSVTLRVATNVPARLSASGKRYEVGRRARRIRVPIRPGRGGLGLRVKLSSGGRVSKGVIRIGRG